MTLIAALYEIDFRFIRFIGVRIVAFAATVTLGGLIIGIICVNIMRPGGKSKVETALKKDDNSWVMHFIYDFFR